MRPAVSIEDRAQQAQVDFLKIDLRLGLTFANLALRTCDVETKRRQTQLARKVYDTIIALREQVTLPDTDNDYLDHNLERLRSELTDLGEVF